MDNEMARKRKDTKKKEEKNPKVNKELEGFDIRIDSFGEIKTTFDIDRINEFLNKNVEDKKLQERKDYDKITKKGKFSDEEE
jgi:hypothetical protein